MVLAPLTSSARRKLNSESSMATVAVKFMRARLCPTQSRAPRLKGRKRLARAASASPLAGLCLTAVPALRGLVYSASESSQRSCAALRF